MRSALGVVTLLVAGLSLVCFAGNTSASDDECRCGRSAAGAQEGLGILLEQESGEQMEWVCETYRYVICVDYDTEPCPWCVVPCQAVCGACFLISDPILALACFSPCIAACAAGCPRCEYCSDYDIEEIVVCGWVLVE